MSNKITKIPTKRYDEAMRLLHGLVKDHNSSADNMEERNKNFSPEGKGLNDEIVSVQRTVASCLELVIECLEIPEKKKT